MKSTVLAILALSSAKVSSVSSCLGTSTPARRATAPLAVSQAICTWRFIGNMSGNSRQWVKTVGSIFFASAWAWALSRMAERFLSVLTRRGALAWYMEMFMGAFWNWAMRTFYRAAISESARPAAARPYRLLTADKLLHDLSEDNDESGHRYQPRRGAHPDDPGDEDHRVGKTRPEEDLRAQERHVVGLARHHRHEHQRCEKHQVLEHVAVRARRATPPAGDLGHALAVADEPHEADLVHRALRRHQHLNNSQHHRPHEQIQLRFHRSSLLSDCGRYGTPISAGIVAALSRGRRCGLGGPQVCKLLTPYATSSPASSAKSRSTHSTCCDPSEASKANERVTQSLGPVTDR